ncbi:carbohydrate ABC transporter permease [Phytoactinopolyspora alkaliphila]|uniref:Carbohydrate ABC transporter permease n=1 Tax=Phytoactinopolyspora alkaliphila TaxID=1783498 RepID=A0A6N9YS12_9ACTN|nr:carbohydrate ABC transporter permease [Phytoactinopolyspora alkaliphila]NED97846.1 carbohydrate ABC transporter permease [Phytoactinopolyspora alkaliphila]
MTATELLDQRPDSSTAPPYRPGHARRADRIVSFINGGFLLVWGLITTLPLVWAMLSAFKTNAQFRVDPMGLPDGLAWDNFARAWDEANIGQYFVNSVIVVTMSLAMTMVFSAMLAYALARYTFIGSKVLYYVFLAGLMFPVFLALVPLFFVVRDTGNWPVIGEFMGLNSHVSLALVYTAFSMPFTVFFLTAFFRTLPDTVAEAGIMDGCSHFSLFWRVMLPMAKPGLVSLALFNFLGHWNQYILPVVIMTEDDKRVLAQGLAFLTTSTGFRADWTALFAGLVIALLPVLIVYIAFQKKVQSGLTAGLLK